MKKLAIDTSTDCLSLALTDGQGLTLETSSRGAAKHGEGLQPAIDSLLKQANWQLNDLDQVYIGLGPGSYTGLRIGVTLVKTWAAFSDIELLSVSSLSLIASQAYPFCRLEADQAAKSIVVPVIDARRGTVYTGAYRYNPQTASFENVLEDRHVDWQTYLVDLQALLDGQGLDQLILIGEDLSPFGSELSNVIIKSLEGDLAYPKALSAFERVSSQVVEDVHTLVPNYAHASLAEQEWAQREGKQIGDVEDNQAYIDRYSSH